MEWERQIKHKQKKLLEILDEFVRVCNQADLNYFLGGGSLLGAFRHKGFIPWDDDIDIFMPRSDYEKLFQIWEAIADTSRFALLRSDNLHNYHFRCIGVADKNTTVVKKYNVHEDIIHGLFIDVMPLDGIPKSKLSQVRQLINVILFNIYNVQRVPNFEGRVVSKLTKLMLGIIPFPKLRYRIWRHAEKVLSQYDLYETQYCKELSTNVKALIRPLPSLWFRTTKIVEFEGRNVKVPMFAEEYLTLIFGDYMVLPPEEERIPKHDETVLFEDLDTPFVNYKGIHYLLEG